MKIPGIGLGLILAMVLSGCDVGSVPILGRALAQTGASPRTVDVSSLPSFDIASWNVSVPRDLEVSEANSIKPVADIVWREDPIGDRYSQVQAIFETALERVDARLDGDLPVMVEIVVSRFHAVTQRTRYSYSGQHEIQFALQVTNAANGEVLVPRYDVNATFRAYGGEEALVADLRGITQKSRILDQLELRLFQELTGAPAANIDEAPLGPVGSLDAN